MIGTPTMARLSVTVVFRWLVRGRRWSRSSRRWSMPSRWGCPLMPARSTSDGCWSCGTGSRGSGSGWSLGGCRCGGLAGSPTRRSRFRSREPGMWIGIWLRWRTRVRGRRSTGSSRRRWCGSTPRPRRPDAGRRPSVVASTSMSIRSPTRALCMSMGSWIWPTRLILRTRSVLVRDSRRTWAAPSRWMCGARSLPAIWPVHSSPWTSTPREARTGPGRSVVLYAHLGRDPWPVREHQVPDRRGTGQGLVR